MHKVTIKGLLAHKLRLALTSLAIVLGVTFIAGTFVLTDTLNRTFNSLVGNVYKNVDFQVRGVAQFPGNAIKAVRNPFPEDLLEKVRHVPGVGGAYGEVGGYAQYVSPAGKAISNGTAEATLGIDFDTDPEISELRLVAGKPPVGTGQVVMDKGTAEKYHFRVGQRVTVLSVGPPRDFTISGIATFGNAPNLAGANLAAFTLPTAQAVVGEVGELNDINVVAGPGADKAAVQAAIARVLPPGVEVVTGQTVVNEETSAINQALSFLSTALLVFAFISLFVGAFTIFNTFSITVGQRTRELALLRVVGASRGQVFRSVLAEAAAVGLASSVTGTGLGVLTAIGLEGLLSGFGISLPSGPLVFEPRTAIVAVAVGVGVTLLSALSPARRAVHVPPVAALVDWGAEADVSARHRFTVGGALGVAGAASLAAGLATSGLSLVGIGAASIFVAVAMLAPGVARPLSAAIGRPLARFFGVPGRLGRQNSMRSPRRTAQTASALMVGLALVSAIAVFGASVSRTATAGVDEAISADVVVTTSSGAMSNAVPTVAQRAQGVTVAAAIYEGKFELDGSVVTLAGVPTQDLAATVILRMTSGSPAALARGQLLIDTSTASSDHLAVGDMARLRFAATGAAQARVGGIYQANALLGSYLASEGYFLAHFDHTHPSAMLLRTTGPAADRALKAALAAFPNLNIQTRAQFQQSQAAGVDTLLGLIYALLALAVLIALIGIVNTLMLSVLERTREIGLLRAVGMRRSQVRSMVRCEAVVLAVFGAVIGIVIGTGLGLALVASISGITDTVVPVSELVVFLVVAAFLGLVAATCPARRASHLDVLAAIATE